MLKLEHIGSCILNRISEWHKESDWKFYVDWPMGGWKIYSPNLIHTLIGNTN